MQDLTNLALFAHVAEHGSFSQAARALGMPKSTLSRRISDLEEAQGVRLLNRTTRRLSLTDVGREFLVHCQTLVQAAEAAEQVTQFVQEKPRGRVRISSPHALSQSLLIKILPAFMQRYPDVQLDLMVSNSPVNLVSEQIDVALRVRSSIEDSSLIARPLAPSPPALFAHPDFIRERGEPKHPTDLVNWPSLSMHYTHGRYQYDFTSCQGESISLTYQPRLITDDLWVLREAASEKQGMVMLPVYLCREYVEKGLLAPVLPTWRLPVGNMHLVYQHRRGLLPAVRVLIDFLLQEMPKAARDAGIGELSDAWGEQN
ncbi:LysR substrate-binding domain-containing protein [Aliidiomarina soli]|uniref:LysR family transcriptional regulator n=1 Tax=Aliidiomarina soli TaxID=1928574 RepID=A0A432WFG5_9GAMM|nr:LysR substrate-binding domain-containing protein [Aliidiomarina soli]RUO32520.1 LysR family transcriptional regulator [Aliidiomarina soli]